MKTFAYLVILGVVLSPMLARGDHHDEPEVKKKVQELNMKIAKATLAGDTKASAAFYTDDAVSMPNYGPMLKGKDAITKHGEEMNKAGFKLHTFEIFTDSVKTVGDYIHEIGTFKLTMTVPGVPDRVTDEGKYLTIWKKQSDGSLKIVTDIWNTNVHPMEAAGK